jgi:hypothetical protein
LPGQLDAVMGIAVCSSETADPPRWIADGAGRRMTPRTSAGGPFTPPRRRDPVFHDRPKDHAEAIALFRAEVI